MCQGHSQDRQPVHKCFFPSARSASLKQYSCCTAVLPTWEELLSASECFEPFNCCTDCSRGNGQSLTPHCSPWLSEASEEALSRVRWPKPQSRAGQSWWLWVPSPSQACCVTTSQSLWFSEAHSLFIKLEIAALVPHNATPYLSGHFVFVIIWTLSGQRICPAYPQHGQRRPGVTAGDALSKLYTIQKCRITVQGLPGLLSL